MQWIIKEVYVNLYWRLIQILLISSTLSFKYCILIRSYFWILLNYINCFIVLNYFDIN